MESSADVELDQTFAFVGTYNNSSREGSSASRNDFTFSVDEETTLQPLMHRLLLIIRPIRGDVVVSIALIAWSLHYLVTPTYP